MSQFNGPRACKLEELVVGDLYKVIEKPELGVCQLVKIRQDKKLVLRTGERITLDLYEEMRDEYLPHLVGIPKLHCATLNSETYKLSKVKTKEVSKLEVEKLPKNVVAEIFAHVPLRSLTSVLQVQFFFPHILFVLDAHNFVNERFARGGRSVEIVKHNGFGE